MNNIASNIVEYKEMVAQRAKLLSEDDKNVTRAGNLAVMLNTYDFALSFFADFSVITTSYRSRLGNLGSISKAGYLETRSGERALAAEGESIHMQQLITVVADYLDLNFDDSNILSVHYDERVNKITDKKTDLVETSISEAQSGRWDKITKGSKVMAVVLYEEGNAKVVKLGILAFDNADDMIDVLTQTVAKTGPAQTTSTKKKKKPRKNQPPQVTPIDNFNEPNFKITDAANTNNVKFQSKISIRIIQDLIGAPMTGVFDDATEKYLFLWQTTKTKSSRGTIEESDMKLFFNTLKASKNYNALIRIVVDFYNLDQQLLGLEEKQYQLPGSSASVLKPKSLDEVLMTIYYREDADPSSTKEAAATSGYPGIAIPALVRMGIGAFENYEFLVESLAHELTHAMQNAGGENAPGGASEFHPYLTGLKGEFGTQNLPVEGLDAYSRNLEMGTEYYAGFTDFPDYVKYSTVMNEYVIAAEGQYNGKFGVSGETTLREKTNNYTTSKAATFSTPVSYTKEENGAILLYENTTILKQLLLVINKADALSKAASIAKKDVSDFNALLQPFSLADWNYPSTAIFGGEYAELFAKSPDYTKDVNKHFNNAKKAAKIAANDALISINKAANLEVDKNKKADLLTQAKNLSDLVSKM